MTVADKTRKLLWSRSGGRCAICRVKLTADATSSDGAAVLGQECHIAARALTGPRAGELPDGVEVDSYDNLILLCGTHHKQVDDQPGEFNAARLRQVKTEHERWVGDRLDDSPDYQVRLLDDSDSPVALYRVDSGQQLWDNMAGHHSSSFRYPDGLEADQTDAVADLLNELEIIEIRDALNMGDIVRAQQQFTDRLEELRAVGLFLYAGRRNQRLEVNGRQGPWSLAMLHFFRADDPAILVRRESGST